jgi:hypothetical protein
MSLPPRRCRAPRYLQLPAAKLPTGSFRVLLVQATTGLGFTATVVDAL